MQPDELSAASIPQGGCASTVAWPRVSKQRKIPATPSCPPVMRARARGEAARSILDIAALSKGGFYFC